MKKKKKKRVRIRFTGIIGKISKNLHYPMTTDLVFLMEEKYIRKQTKTEFDSSVFFLYANVFIFFHCLVCEFTRHLRLSSLKWGLLWKSYFRTVFNGFVRAAYSSSNTDGVGMQTTL